MGSPSCATARRPRRPRLGRCAGTACVRSRPDALCQFVGGWSAGAAQPRTKFTSGAVARAIDPEAWEGPPEHLGSGVVGKLRAGASRCARVGQAPVLPFGARKTRPTRRHTAIVPHTNRAAFGGCPSSVRRLPHHWGPELAPRSVRRRDRSSTPVRSSRRATAVARRVRADAVPQKSRGTPPTQ